MGLLLLLRWPVVWPKFWKWVQSPRPPPPPRSFPCDVTMRMKFSTKNGYHSLLVSCGQCCGKRFFSCAVILLS
uniref:Putative secreted protein n=1 Tax=Anopheles marajoara TaxID=58244 RepID=A0A2M4CDL7_9DIPT